MTLCIEFRAAPWSEGESLALAQGTLRWSYRQLRGHVVRRANLLRALGLVAGQVVMVPDTPVLDLFLMQHALARSGAILFPYRAGISATELRTLMDATGAEWSWRGESDALTAVRSNLDASNETAASTLALLIRTSGSSGRPKAAMLSVGNVIASAQGANANLGLGPGDQWLACLRMSHIGGISIGYRCALAGASLRLHEGFDAGAVHADLHRHPVTHLSLVPPMLARLIELDPKPPPSLRAVLIGGQALSPTLAQRAIDAGWPLHLSYGMTETASQIATTPRIEGELPPPGVVGRVLPGCELRLRGCDQAPTRLCIKGPTVMAGYANPERRMGDGLKDGWLETADLACSDPEGRLRILGRADDIRVIGGNNVSLARVESVLDGAPGIDELVVVALDDPIWGHRLVAAYSGTGDPAELGCWCVGRLSGAERPRGFLRLSALPLLESGKYDRAVIRALAQGTADMGLG